MKRRESSPPAFACLYALWRRPVTLVASSLALLIVGLWCWHRLPLELLPSIELPQITVGASWPGASPQAMERDVVAPLERAVQSVPGIVNIRSFSAEGMGALVLELSEGRDLGVLVAEIGERLSWMRRVLPPGVAPRLTRQVPARLRGQQGFMILSLSATATPDVLRSLAEEEVAPVIAALPRVAGVEVKGGRTRELRVSLRADRLRSYGLSPAAVEESLSEVVSGMSFGSLKVRGGSILLLRTAPGGLEEISQLPLRRPDEPADGGASLVRLRDVARVELRPAPVADLSRLDGEAVVSLIITREPGSDLLATARRVRELVAELNPQLPEGVGLAIAQDRSEQVAAELIELGRYGGLGLLVVIVVITVMLRSRQAVILVLFSVAVVLALSFTLLSALGLSLNLLTLAALVLLVGLLIDNAVVLVEQILAQRSAGPGAFLNVGTAERSLKAVWLPLWGGTLTTVVVLVPLVYASRELRALFVPLAVLVALSLIFSLLSAALLIPAVGRLLARPAARGRPGRSLRRALGAPYRLAVGAPRLILGALCLLLASVLFPFFKNVSVGESWGFGAFDELRVEITLPPGADAEQTDRLIRGFEEKALAWGRVEQTLVRVQDNCARLHVQFEDGARATKEPFVLRQQFIEQSLQLAGVEVSISGLLPLGYHNGIGETAPGFELEAFGPNYHDLERLLRRFAERLEGYPRVAAVDVQAGPYGSSSSPRILQFDWKAEAAAFSGLEARDLARQLRSRLWRYYPSYLIGLGDRERLPLRVEMDGAGDQGLAELLSSPVRARDGKPHRIADLADFRVTRQPQIIERLNQRYKRYVKVYDRGPHRLGEALIERELAALSLPPGYQLNRAETGLFSTGKKRELWALLVAAAGLVYLLIAAIFESWRAPWVVLLGLPAAAIGVALAFLIADASFAEGAFVGLLLVVGIAVNDTILLTYRHQQIRGRRPRTAPPRLALLALRQRLIPMWTTTLSSVGGLLPLLFISEGSDFWYGLALTVVGGLISSTLLAPLAMVAVLSLRKPEPQKGLALTSTARSSTACHPLTTRISAASGSNA